MPLKHFTETYILFLLGVVIAFTGVLTATLPDLPEGALPLGLIFLATVLYALAWNPLFKKRRADYSLRLLHWVPALILVVWALLQGLSVSDSEFEPLLDSYRYAWTLSAVTIGFTLLAAFCLHVIRRRNKRVVLLLCVFIPFVAFAIISEEDEYHWEQELAATLWQGDWWNVYREGGLLAGTDGGDVADDDQGLQTSNDEGEEAWRERLRAQRRREERIRERLIAQKDGGEDMQPPEKVPMEKVPEVMKAKPVKLTDSGPGLGAFGVVLLAGYTGTLHRRVRGRRS